VGLVPADALPPDPATSLKLAGGDGARTLESTIQKSTIDNQSKI